MDVPLSSLQLSVFGCRSRRKKKKKKKKK